MRAILTTASLEELATTEWFLDEPWQSSRYRGRYERPYRDIRPHLLCLASALASGNNALGSAVDHLVAASIVRLEAALWFQGLRRYPERLLHLLIPAELLTAIRQTPSF